MTVKVHPCFVNEESESDVDDNYMMTLMIHPWLVNEESESDNDDNYMTTLFWLDVFL